MKLIVGLGNPGDTYKMTRHNAGFLGADFLQKEWEFAPFVLDKKISAEISSGALENEKVLIVKPHTFMNHSGTVVQTLLQFYKLSLSDIAVIHDDLDIAPGTFKVSISARSAGHNGVQDIIDTLGTNDFLRVRLGLGRPNDITKDDQLAHNFVLQNFSAEELSALTKLFPEVQEKLVLWLNSK
jgi:peptidyl-tRNA hydrolase, PTH1 family